MLSQKPIIFSAILFCLLLTVACGREPAIDPPSGQLLLVANDETAGYGILQHDVTSKNQTPLFTAPEFTQIHQISHNNSTDELILSYTPPPTIDSGFFDRSGLFRLPLASEANDLQPITEGALSQEFYLQQALTPDGRWLYFIHFEPEFAGGITNYTIGLQRIELATGQRETVAQNSNWPILSPDGAQLAYIAINPETEERALITADLDGTNQQTLIPFGRFFDVDIPIYSPDGRWIYFTVANPPEETRTFWEKLAGVHIAEAHSNLPSYWWRIPSEGGEPEQVSRELVIIRAGDFSPDGNYLAYTSDIGLHIMTAEDGNELPLVPHNGVGDLIWLE